MTKSTILLLFIILASCQNSTTGSMHSTNKAEAKISDEWISLFDGHSINGWHSYGKKTAGSAWKVENGAMHLDAASKKSSNAEGGDLVTDEEYENFHLKLDWKIAPLGNSGIIFYVNEDPGHFPETYNSGPELQLLDNGTPTTPGNPDARFYTHRAGDLYDLLASREVVKPAGQWNSTEIIANKGKLDFYMNGQHTLSTTMWNDSWKQMIAISKFKDMPGFGSFRKGRIALQDHGFDVWFRNIKIKRMQ
jgi:hypothetical protein